MSLTKSEVAQDINHGELKAGAAAGDGCGRCVRVAGHSSGYTPHIRICNHRPTRGFN